MKNIQNERFFFNTFGYHMIDTYKAFSKKDVILDFESEISRGLKKPSIGMKSPYVGIDQRESGIRYSQFNSDNIYNVFYNPHVLDEIYKIIDDFVICSPIESFYLTNSNLHKDTASEIKILNYYVI
jgi:hypothetical protein